MSKPEHDEPAHQPLLARPSSPQPPIHDIPAHKPPEVAPAGPKFVVLHEGLGSWRGGRVISTAELDEVAPGQIPRLLGLKAIRPADAVESAQTDVKVIKEGEKYRSYESVVVEGQKEADKLKLENAGLRSELDTVKRGHQAPGTSATHEKDAEIADLKHKLALAEKRHHREK